MADDRVGWSFEDRPVPPPKWTVEAVGYLIRLSDRNEQGSEPKDARHVFLWTSLRGKMFNAVNPRWLGWPLRLPHGKATADREAKSMGEETSREAEEQHANAIEAALLKVVSHPELGEEAFPDRTIRDNVIPLLQHLRAPKKDTPKSG